MGADESMEEEGEPTIILARGVLGGDRCSLPVLCVYSTPFSIYRRGESKWYCSWRRAPVPNTRRAMALGDSYGVPMSLVFD